MVRLTLLFFVFIFSLQIEGQVDLDLNQKKYDIICIHPKGKYVQALGNLRQEISHGKWWIYNSNGILVAEGKYRKGKRHGLWKYYDTEGSLMEIGKYKKGKKEGYWKVYDKFVVFEDGLVVNQNVFK